MDLKLLFETISDKKRKQVAYANDVNRKMRSWLFFKNIQFCKYVKFLLFWIFNNLVIFHYTIFIWFLPQIPSPRVLFPCSPFPGSHSLGSVPRFPGSRSPVSQVSFPSFPGPIPRVAFPGSPGPIPWFPFPGCPDPVFRFPRSRSPHYRVLFPGSPFPVPRVTFPSSPGSIPRCIRFHKRKRKKMGVLTNNGLEFGEKNMFFRATVYQIW